MKKIRKKNEKSYISITKYPYLLTTYNKNYNKQLNNRNNKSYNNTHNKMTININNTFCLFNPDEEYVTKLNFFNIGSRRDNKKRETLYNLNTVPQFPSILKKDHENAESFKEKKRILNELNSKKALYDKENNSDDSKQTYVNRYENTIKENKLEKERKEIEKKIYKLKEMVKSLSNELSITIKEIDNLKLDVDIMQNYRSYNLFNKNNLNKKNENKNKDNNNNQSLKEKNNNEDEKENIQTKKRKSISSNKDPNIDKEKSKEKEKDNRFKMEMMLLTKSEKVSKLKQEMKVKIKELEEKKGSLLEKIEICENELKKFKEIHHNLKEELLVHYHRLLSEGKDTRKEGLSWIILAIWNLKSNVLLSYLPKFLDQNIVLFLFEYSSLLKKIKETEKKIHELAIKLKEHKENANNTPNNFREELNKYMYKNNNKKNKHINYKSQDEDKNSNNKDNFNNSNNNREENNEDKEENISNKDENKNEELLNNDELIKEEENENENDIDENDNNKIDEENEEEQHEAENKEENNDDNDGDDDDKYNDTLKEEKKDNKQQTKFIETFKTSLYNTNSEKIGNKNNNLFFEKDNFKNNKENNFLKNKECKAKKDKNKRISMPSNFIKSLFKKEDLYKSHKNIEDKEEKIKLCDFKNIYNKRQSYSVDIKTFELFNEHKNMEKYYSKLKEEAELLMKKELDIVNKSFYLYDYGGKYNVDQKTVISALVGEDSVRSELNKQKKQEKEYFKTLRELRNGKAFQKKNIY